ncbi:DsbA family protein [Colwellia sp. UCD-KL20]|uniref:DsbA family protein n=1 Tax=Colwellia sp. UCD-KL20 TaxID=1917165 RepID=UPI000970AD7E|nr:DsbA family protein [Colwellia sp. UCD-KL20]
MQDIKFIIIYDTYCGWCYGAAPVFDALIKTNANVEVLHRHLFQGINAPKMKEGKGDYILKMDAQIAKLTGQEFSQKYIENVVLSNNEILDSTYSALAAALVHEQGAFKEFSLRQRLEKQRFIEGKSAQNREAIIQALIEEGIEPDSAQCFDNKHNVIKADMLSKRAVKLMAQVSSNGVPTILKIEGNTITKINHSQFYSHPELISSLATTSTLN